MESSKTKSNMLQIIFESGIPWEFCECFAGLRKCGFDKAESIILAFGDYIIGFNSSKDIPELMLAIADDEEKISNSRDSLDIQIYKIDLDLLVCLLKNTLNQLLGENQS